MSDAGALLWHAAMPTFLAMTTLVAACCTLLTVPPLPAPSSFNTTRSSARKSNRNSTPISSVSPRSLLFPIPPGICASPAEGLGVLGCAAFNANPLTFFLFIVRVLKASDDILTTDAAPPGSHKLLILAGRLAEVASSSCPTPVLHRQDRRYRCRRRKGAVCLVSRASVDVYAVCLPSATPDHRESGILWW